MTKLFRLTLILALAVVFLLAFMGSLLSSKHRVRIGRLKLPTGSGVPMVSLGATHGLILACDGSLWSWGADFLGWPVLGLGNVHTQANLCRIGNETNWISISAGTSHNVAVKSDGTLWAWGEDIYGQLGDGQKAFMQSNAVPSAPGNDWKQASAGGSHTLALKRDGTLWAWGNNWAGQLGINSMKDTLAPGQIGSGTNWVKVWAGSLHGAALQSDGSLWVWGDNPANSNQLSRTTKNLIAPTRISDDTNWVNAAFGNMVLLAIKSDGTLWAWGRHASNYTGIADQPTIPNRVGTNSDWQSCSCAEWARDMHVLLRKKDGTLWSLQSLFGNGSNLNFVEINLHKDWVAVAGGGGGSIGAYGMHDGVCSGIGLARDGEVWAWGRALGEFTPEHPLLEALGKFAKKIDGRVHWGEPQPVTHVEPWQLRNVDTNVMAR